MTLSELGIIVLIVAGIFVVFGAIIGRLITGGRKESVLPGAPTGAFLGFAVAVFVAIFVVGVGVGQETRTYNLVSLDQTDCYQRSAGVNGNETLFCIEKGDEEITLVTSDSIVSAEHIDDDAKPYAEITSYADLQKIRKVVLYLP